MSRPNLLLICCDHLSPLVMGAYGDTYGATPQMDALAARGVRFERCYTPCPLCRPARTAYWTGRYPHDTGVLGNGREWYDAPVADTVPTLGSLLAAAGYACHHFGKTHDHGALRGFEVHRVEPRPVAPADPAWPLNADTFQDVDTTARVEQFLGRPPAGPFACVADLNNPHNICGWIGENQRVHSDRPIPAVLPELPANFTTEDWAARPPPVAHVCCSHRRQSQTAGWTPENFRYYRAAFYHYTRRADDDVGRMLAALARGPAAANTLVVLFADHGDALGAHGLVTKQVCFYEEATRVPLVIAGPGVVAAGGIRRPLASLLDLLPTLCEVAGATPPAGLRGRSLVPWLRGDPAGGGPEQVVSEWHTEWGYTVEPGRMLRTDRWKYIRYLEGPSEELYDLVADPGEMVNRAADPASAAVLAVHRDRLARHLAATADPFETLTVKVDPRWRSHPPGPANHTGPSAPEVAAGR
jgi:choline-sulfatase